MIEKPTYAVGVSVLITQEDKLLLGERINVAAAGLLSTPGGRIELDEDMFACAIRETKEETDLEINREDLEILGFREHFRFGEHYFMIYIHATKFKGTLKNRIPDKSKDWKFIPIKEILPHTTTEPADILANL